MAEKKKDLRQIAAYIFYALLTTLVNWLVYSLIVRAYKLGGSAVEEAEISAANSAAWFAAVMFSFFVNKIRVFGSTTWKLRPLALEMAMFFSTRLASGLVEIVLVPLLVWLGIDGSLFGVEGLTSKLIVTPTLILLNYLIGKFLVFRKKDA